MVNKTVPKGQNMNNPVQAKPDRAGAVQGKKGQNMNNRMQA